MQILIIGAGVFGVWCAWWLAARGHKVTLVDAYGAANARASSADHSRVIRCGYGADGIYSRWARESRADWEWLSAETGRALVEPAGALFMGAPHDAYVAATRETLSRLGITSETLDPQALAARFPQIATRDLGDTLLEPGAGVIRARLGVHTLVALMEARRLAAVRIARVQALDESRAPPIVVTTAGERLDADAFVCCTGPWLPALLPGAVGARIRPTRQEVLHFGVPAGDERFSLRRLPVWIDFAAGLYGIPDLDGRGFKVGIDRHGPALDPDAAERLVDPSIVERTRAWLATRFPALAGAPLVESRVCQYENTDTGDFVIDRHPQWSNVWIAGGGSGHGFKHGPAVGRYVAGLIAGDTAAEPRFAQKSKDITARRAVH
jgi:sarcosine oxidase